MTQDLRLSLKYQIYKINKLGQNFSKVSFIEEWTLAQKFLSLNSSIFHLKSVKNIYESYIYCDLRALINYRVGVGNVSAGACHIQMPISSTTMSTRARKWFWCIWVCILVCINVPELIQRNIISTTVHPRLQKGLFIFPHYCSL